MKKCMEGVMVVTLAGMAAAQPVQWRVEDGGNGHWYDGVVVSQWGASWSQAREVAVSMGGDLSSLNTAAERLWVFTNVGSRTSLWRFDRYSVGPWIGGTRTGAEWWWLDGEAIGNSVVWDVGQPDNAVQCGGPEDKLHWFIHNASGPQDWVNDSVDAPVSMCIGPVIAAVIEYSADCNGDGIVDKGQILSGHLADANNNGIPDGPGILVQPTDQTVGVDASVTFIVEVAASTCSAPVTYQWQRRNPAVADPQSPGGWIDLSEGGGFLNTRSPALAIARPTPALATGYRCKIGGGCGCEPGQGGFVYTDTVNFSVACPADFNADGGIDSGDVEAFFERWENGC